MTAEKPRNVGRATRKSQVRPAVEVDCSSWGGDPPSTPRTTGRFVRKTSTHAATEVSCTEWGKEEANDTKAQGEMQLVATGNTDNPSLIVLRQKGYELWLEKGENGSLWCAKKGSQRFLAYNGPELLGLVNLWESLGENWNRQEPDIYRELLDRMEQ